MQSIFRLFFTKLLLRVGAKGHNNNIPVVAWELTILSLRITVRNHSASLMMLIKEFLTRTSQTWNTLIFKIVPVQITIGLWMELTRTCCFYRKFPKYSDTEKICCNHSKIWTMWLYHRVMSPNDVDGVANSADPDQTAPLGAVWSESALFAQTCLSENLGKLW